MIDFLHHLSDPLVFVLVSAVLVPLITAAPHLRARIYPARGKDPQSSEPMDAFIAIASTVAVLLTFSLVQVESTARHVQDQIAREAAHINDTDRTLARFGDPALAALRPIILDYARIVTGDELRQPAEDGRSELADALYARLSVAARAVEPVTKAQQAMFAELIQQLDEIDDLREERIAASHTGLPGIYWATAGAMLLVLLVLATMIEPRSERTWVMAVITSAIALLFALVIIFDAPFKGSGKISDAPMKRALELMAIRK